MYQTLGKIAILLPLLLVVGYSERAYAITSDNFDSYSTGYIDSGVTNGNWFDQNTNKWQVLNGEYFSSPNSLGILSAIGYHATTTISTTGTISRYSFHFKNTDDTGEFSFSLTNSNDYNTDILKLRIWTDSFDLENSTGAVYITESDLCPSYAIATSTWYSAYIDYKTDNTFRVSIPNCAVSDWYSTATTTSPTIFRIAGSDGMYIDDFNSSSVQDNDCLTCTRVIDTDPIQGQTIATTTSLDYFVDYYVSSDDYDAGNTYISLTYQHALNNPLYANGYSLAEESFTSNILGSGESTSIFNFAYVYATGTYNVNVRIYTVEEPSWWQFWADPVEVTKATYQTNFYAGQPTQTGEYEASENISRIENYFLYTATALCDPTDIPCFARYVASTTLHGVPFGYVMRIYDIFRATTSTTTEIAITHIFPSTSPAYGSSITLNINDAIETATATYGDTYNKILALWNLFWYTMLAFWIFKSVVKYH